LSHFLAQFWLKIELQAVPCRDSRWLLCLVTGFPNRREQKGRTPLKRARCRSQLFGTGRDRPDALQPTDRITL